MDYFTLTLKFVSYILAKIVQHITMVFPLLGISDHVNLSVSIDFPSNSKHDAPFHGIAYDYFCVYGTVFVIIWEMFYGRISLNSVLLLLKNFVSGVRFELMYRSLIESIRSSRAHFHGFQLLLLLPNLHMLLKQKSSSFLRNLALSGLLVNR